MPGVRVALALAAVLQEYFNKAMHLGVRWYCRFVRREIDRWPQMPRAAICATLAAAMIFTVVRNLPLGLLR
jgi:hypothetical protein